MSAVIGICRSFGPTEQMALLDSDCPYDSRPTDDGPCPALDPCPTDLSWRIGSWDQVSFDDEGFKNNA